jgi:hypothetical protein
MTTGVYAYIHCKPDGTPFYVGKGLGKRYLPSSKRNAHYRRTADKYGISNIGVGIFPCSSNSIALELEVGLIKCLRTMGILLTNQTDGGEGALGRPCSDICKTAVAKANSERVWTDAAREKTGLLFRGKKRPDHSEYLKSLGMWSGKNNIWFGTGDRQLGAKNHMAKAIQGTDKLLNIKEWPTLTDASLELGVSIQAISQSIRKGQRSKGWLMEHKI